MDFTGGQFPALDGYAEDEVAQRTEPETAGLWFRRVFTVHNRLHTKGLPADHPMHAVNFGAVLQDALQRGLHPKAAPELESEADHPSDPNSTDLTYRVFVVPASVDDHPETTVTPSTLAAVMADPDALEPIPDPEPDPAAERWTRGETGEEADPAGGGVAPAQTVSEAPPAEPTPAPAAEEAPVDTPPVPEE